MKWRKGWSRVGGKVVRMHNVVRITLRDTIFPLFQSAQLVSLGYETNLYGDNQSGGARLLLGGNTTRACRSVSLRSTARVLRPTSSVH